jgi:hypothetical protein
VLDHLAFDMVRLECLYSLRSFLLRPSIIPLPTFHFEMIRVGLEMAQSCVYVALKACASATMLVGAITGIAESLSKYLEEICGNSAETDIHNILEVV